VRAVAVIVSLLLASGSARATPTHLTTLPIAGSVRYLEGHQGADGGFAEPNGQPDASLTEWAAIALAAGGGSEAARAQALGYLRGHEAEASSDTDVALAAFARAALGDRPDALLARLRGYRPGPLVNATTWTILALRQAGQPVAPSLTAALRKAQRRSGGWSWTARGAPDSNDTAAAIEALRSVGVTGRPIARGVAFLARCRNVDGGYGLDPGRASDAQSTAWAIQAQLASGVGTASASFRFLARLHRPDGSYRYSARYATTPVWVTSQVVPALARKALPLV